MGVPEKYAGRGVKCTKCGVGVKVPELEPPELDASELVPLDSADDGLDSYDMEDSHGDGGDLFDGPDMLAELAGPAGGAAIVAAPAAEAAGGGGSCPSCGAGVGPNAVICIQCGHNLKSGGKTKIKVGKDRVGGGGIEWGFSGRTIVAWLLGAVVGGVCVVVWLVLAMLTAKQNSYLAWGTGGLIGLTVGAVHQRRSIVAGIGAVVLALCSVAAVKMVFVLVLSVVSAGIGMMDEMTQMNIDAAMDDPAVFVEVYQDHMYSEELFEPELQGRVDTYYENYEIDFVDGEIVESEMDEQLVADLEQAVQAEIGGMSEEDKRAFLEGYYGLDEMIEADAEDEIDMDELRDMNPLLASLSWFDALWIPLCIFSAYMSGQGKE